MTYQVEMLVQANHRHHSIRQNRSHTRDATSQCVLDRPTVPPDALQLREDLDDVLQCTIHSLV